MPVNDPYWDSTVLLLHGEASSDPNLASCTSGFSCRGDTPEIGTFVSYGSTPYVEHAGRKAIDLSIVDPSTNFTLSGTYGGAFNANFTIEFWYYQTVQTSGSMAYFAAYPAPSGQCVLYNDGAGVRLNVRGTLFAGVPITYPLNSWVHHAIVCSGGFVSYYVDGVRKITGTAGSTTGSASGPRFGAIPSYVTAGVPGYVNDIRVYPNLVKYSGASFSVPAWPMPSLSWVYDASSTARSFFKYGAPVAEYMGNTKFGTGSMSFNGASYFYANVASPSNAFGTADFTVEAWVYHSASATYQAIVGQWDASTAASWGLEITIDNHLVFLFQNTTSAYHLFSDAGDVLTGQWVHCAVSRQGANLRLFINGVLSGIRTDYATLQVGQAVFPIYVGRAYYVNTHWYTGQIEDVRITNGVARYVTNFVPPGRLPEGQTSVSGVIRDITNAPCARQVHVHAREGGRLLGTTVSDPITGAYAVTARESCYVVVLDSTGDYDALIHDRINPLE